MNAMDVIPYEIGAYYIFDRGYIDFTRLKNVDAHFAYFVIRAKSNLKFRRMYSNKVDKSTGVIYDQIGRLTGFYVSKQYSDKLRRVKFYDNETGRIFVFLTNNMDITAEQVALLYKNRWQIELFFKESKQLLGLGTDQSNDFDSQSSHYDYFVATHSNHNKIPFRQLRIQGETIQAGKGRNFTDQFE